jgi:hypothetical protein
LRIPRFPEKNGNYLRQLAKAVERSKIVEILGKYGPFGGFFGSPENPGVAGSTPALSTSEGEKRQEVTETTVSLFSCPTVATLQ